MAFGFAGAAAGAARSLEDIVAERLLAQKLEAEIENRQQQTAMDQSRLNEMTSQNAWERGRADRLDQERSAERATAADAAKLQQRGRSNMAGVMAMGVDPQTAKREIAFSALQSGADVPSGVMEAITPPKKREYTYTDPKTGAKSLRYADADTAPEGGIDLGREPVKAEKPQVFNVGNGTLVDSTGKVIYQPKGAGGASPYAQERAARTVQSVDELMGKVNGMTAGWGSMLSSVPESQALDFKAELDTLKANVAFNELTQMREASKTGGALGSVAVREMELLQSALGALEQAQSPENLKAQLQKVKDSIGRWENANGAGGLPPPSVPAGRRLRFDRTGKPIP